MMMDYCYYCYYLLYVQGQFKGKLKKGRGMLNTQLLPSMNCRRYFRHFLLINAVCTQIEIYFIELEKGLQSLFIHTAPHPSALFWFRTLWEDRVKRARY